MALDSQRSVVVVGGGFGGLTAVRRLAAAGLPVTLIDRHNYHLFQPLSYQVATGALSPGDIAMPLRHVFRRAPSVTVLLGEVCGFDLGQRRVAVRSHGAGTITVPYESLIVAGGSDYSYFGHEQWRQTALEVKTLDSALEVRGRILHAFEAAELDPSEQEAWLTFVVVGAGPTGVEMAGQIAELARDTLAGEFRRIDSRRARILLIETADRVLGSFPAPLPQRAQRSLERLGVSVLLRHTVVDVREDAVELQAADGGRSLVRARTVVWAAGVQASPLAGLLAQAAGAQLDRAGRLMVDPGLALPGHPEVLALGDMVQVLDGAGHPRNLPGLAPVAMQQGRYAAAVIAARRRGDAAPGPFRYRDKGMLATIGRASAVADLRGLRFSGFAAWAAWLLVHIFYLIGFENRIVVLFRWAYSYLTRGRGSRLITAAAALGERRRG